MLQYHLPASKISQASRALEACNPERHLRHLLMLLPKVRLEPSIGLVDFATDAALKGYGSLHTF
eukprot:2944241-Amphidinium_carterae.1